MSPPRIAYGDVIVYVHQARNHGPVCDKNPLGCRLEMEPIFVQDRRLGAQVLPVTARQKQNAPVFTEASRRPSIPSPYVQDACLPRHRQVAHRRCRTYVGNIEAGR